VVLLLIPINLCLHGCCTCRFRTLLSETPPPPPHTHRILILKGKEASFLQVYHHTGIAFIMWEAVCSQSAWLQFVTLLNSLIHTIMYI
jgi:hypothetical protein